MSEIGSNKERMRVLIRENRARPLRKELMKAAAVDESINSGLSLTPMQEGRDLSSMIFADYRRICALGAVIEHPELTVENACRIVHALGADSTGVDIWSFSFERELDIGLLVTKVMPTPDTLEKLCSFDRESVWVGADGIFFAVIDMEWDGKWNLNSVKCTVTTISTPDRDT